MTTLKHLWRNEYFQTIVMTVSMVMVFLAFWYGTQWVLNTEHPALAVVSTSMLPTLNVGDLIIVQGIAPEELNAQYITGDVVVFRDSGNVERLIVHRAVRIENVSGVYRITTHGDNNPVHSEETFSQDKLVGKVVGRVPYVGNLALITHSLGNTYFLIVFAIIAIVIISMLPLGNDNEDESAEEQKSLQKLNRRMISVFILVAIIIIFVIFGLVGALTFWQPGAEPPQNVTIRGMYPDFEFHENYYETFRKDYNNIHETFLFQGFLTYTIDCNVSDSVHAGIRPGIPTFSWVQTAIVALIFFGGWELLKYLRLVKTDETTTNAQTPSNEAMTTSF